MPYTVTFWRALALCTALLLPTIHTKAQSWRLPDDRKNTRHTTDLFDIPRPALSVRGFDNTRTSSAYHHSKSSTTYGVRQVLERAYGISPVSQEGSVLDVFVLIKDNSTVTFAPFTTSGNVNSNAQILESQAFMALVTFIIEENDGDPGEPNIFTSTIKSRIAGVPSHTTARNRLISSLQAKDDFSTFHGSGSPFKRIKALSSLARALDLYYALENAYEDLNGPTNQLLSASDKQFWNNEIHDDIQTVWEQTQADLTSWGTGFADVQTHEVQGGNWPLISFAGLGYVVLGFNGPFAPIFDDDHGPSPQDHEDVLNKAIKSTAFRFDQSGLNKRYNYWWYQTDAGKAFWAEHAYYFDITLIGVLPFWHAIRANDFLDYGSGDNIDPFFYQPFVNPIEWLAEIATPDGRTPPLDDGNKRTIRSANLLRWTSAYGNATSGRKFVWISEESGSFGSIPESRIVEISVPRTSSGIGSSPLAGNDLPNETGEGGEQQMILRRTHSNNDHYVFLNGESDSALENGEGHEQGDQMQLLYYVNDTSYLIDSGYDNAEGIPNSTWNHYYDHNVMIGYAPNTAQGDGGIQPPSLNAVEKRINSEHQSVDEIYGYTSGNVDILSSKMFLRAYDLNGTQLDFVDYRRKIFFVNDPSRPYLIDINGANGYDEYSPPQGGGELGFKFTMNYNVNTNLSTLLSAGDNIGYLWRDMYESENSTTPSRTVSDLFMQPMVVEQPVKHQKVTYKAQEADMDAAEGDGVQVSRLLLRCGSSSNDRCLDHTTIGIIRSLPTGESAPVLATPNVEYRTDGLPLTMQYFTWQHDNSTVDVIVARSAGHYRYPSLREDIDVPISEAGGFYVRLPDNSNYGFARLTKTGSLWAIDSDYQVNLIPGEAPPLEIAIWGPSCVVEDELGTWTADVSGGVPPYNNLWEYYPECGGPVGGFGPINDCGTWHYGGYSTSFSYTPTTANDLQVRLTVTDDENNSETVIKYVNVDPDGPNACSNYKTASADEEVVSIDNLSVASLPDDYALLPNYPNPFNSSTVIRFALPEAAKVELVVYDAMGRQVKTLVDRQMEGGNHTTTWKVEGIPSGTYFYRLTAGSYTQTKTMQIVK